MKYVIDNQEYEVVIIKKNNKNTYIRVKEDLKIYVTTNYLASKSYIKNLLDNNYNEIEKMILNINKKIDKNKEFRYLNQIYDIIIVPSLSNIQIDDNIIFTPTKELLDKWLKKETINIFKIELDKIYQKFNEDIPYPKLKIRKMTTRWGVCNRKNNTITLNSELIKYSIDCIDYVIVHELAHFVYFDHSKNFWGIVSKYFKNYKEVRKILKD